MEISKQFKNSEIIGRLSNGDLYLHMGVRRKSYNREDVSLVNNNPWTGHSNEESYINYEAYEANRVKELKKRVVGVDDLNDSGEIDNWETE